MLVSLCYLVLPRVLQLAALRVRSNDFKELEIVVLRHELAILRRQRKRPVLTTVDRLFLAAASRFLARERWRSFMITPATLLRWHRRLVAKRWTFTRQGRPPMRREIRARGPHVFEKDPAPCGWALSGSPSGLVIIRSTARLQYATDERPEPPVFTGCSARARGQAMHSSRRRRCCAG